MQFAILLRGRGARFALHDGREGAPEAVARAVLAVLRCLRDAGAGAHAAVEGLLVHG